MDVNLEKDEAAQYSAFVPLISRQDCCPCRTLPRRVAKVTKRLDKLEILCSSTLTSFSTYTSVQVDANELSGVWAARVITIRKRDVLDSGRRQHHKVWMTIMYSVGSVSCWR